MKTKEQIKARVSELEDLNLHEILLPDCKEEKQIAELKALKWVLS